MIITENLKRFIKQYKVATKLNWSRANLADYLSLTPDTIRRKIDKINSIVGIRLQQLPLNGKPLSQKMINDFENTGDFSVPAMKEKQVYLITSAQNATPIHTGFFNACMQFCKDRNAEFKVIKYRYKNPTSIWTQNNKDYEWWMPKLEPYIMDSKKQLCENLIILGNIKTQPTQSDPLSGLEGFSGMNSIIVGHPKIQLKSAPTLNGKFKLMLTTGTITEPNYTDSKAGSKAEFHHSMGAIVVEVDGDIFHIRHIHANSKGSFYDLDKLYTSSGVTSGHRAEALVTGDIHAEFIDSEVEHATFHATDSIVNVLRPKKIFLPDIVDFYSRNHHHRGNDVIAYGKHKYGRNNVQAGLQEAADFIDRVSSDETTIYIIRSNHDEAFDRWLRESDIRTDPENADFFYYMKYHQMKNTRITDTGFQTFDAFEFWCKEPENGRGLQHINTTKFLKRDESEKVCSIEVAYHGDIGVNGSRGDIKGFSRVSDKMIISHSHTPGINEGCYQVGLSAKKNLEYRKGPSTWMHTHCIIYPDGKRTLIHVVGSKTNGIQWKA